ncbi:sulfate/molybdate ABC transporter ATP-binding protein [Phreatobacter sp.]|uniref:sulfate/molybdate ABC transporter ATP-binding protein n=1 Tax=Phreatobacter sp. TaxID=1966341 RepID=UPI0025EC39D1|nr:sulfate/molybdate ABC transporter ATP-binding protein [Phreatobacter sp.]
MTGIAVRGVAKDFAGTRALDGIDLDIRPGELLALLGPSGSGKTTLLRSIAGLEPLTAGTIHFGGEDATGLRVQDRKAGFVFQHYALFRHMTVAENIAYGLTVRPRAERPARHEILRRVEDLLDLVQLPGIGKRFPGQLSGGQRQRVALARALAVEPRVLLLDEPFGALDAQVRKDLRRWLRDIHQRTGHTTVFVTHDQEEAVELADRVAILNRGRVEQVGSPDEVLDHPANAFVAGFVGQAVRLDVTVAEGRVRADAIELGAAPAGIPDGAASLFLRTGDIAVVRSGGTTSGVVTAITRSAASRRLEIRLSDDLPAVEAEVSLDQQVARGERVALTIRADRLFPATR